jgi:hypothetical protein
MDKEKFDSKKWREEENKKQEEFKQGLKDKYKLQDNPKFDELYRISWEYGHSSGYNEVELYFSELVNLIR